MSLHSHDSSPSYEEPPSPAERRQRLAVLCALDRVQLRLVFAPTPHVTEAPSANIAAEGIKTVLGAARFLPGKLGLWARRAGLAASFIRLLK